MKGLHDDPSIYGPLPGKPMNEEVLKYTPEDGEYRIAWEYVLSHQMTTSELTAFWQGVSIQAKATRRTIRANIAEVTRTSSDWDYPDDAPDDGTKMIEMPRLRAAIEATP